MASGSRSKGEATLAGDKGLNNYITAMWEGEDGLDKFKAYTKSQNNQILSRHQLRCLKQDDMPLEEFLTKAQTLINDKG